MVIVSTADRAALLRQTRKSLGLPADAATLDDDALLAAAGRRLAGFVCPCPAATLAGRLSDSFYKLIKLPDDDLRQRSKAVVERMIVHGDLLELSDVTTSDERARNSWVFAAPPTFMMRPEGVAILLGVTPDENTPLPAKLAERISYEGHLRFLAPASPDEDLAAILEGLGLVAVSEEAWLKPPKEETAADHVIRLDRLLANQGPAGEITGLRILDPKAPKNYYLDRWTEPKKRSGNFVARRPQAYGSDIWGYVTIDEGQPVKFLDFPLKGDRYRGCDAAWRLQCAIDARQGGPLTFRIRALPDDLCAFDFFGPLPMWAERRFALLGKALQPEQAMLSYSMPNRERLAKVAFLAKYLWLSATEKQQQGG